MSNNLSQGGVGRLCLHCSDTVRLIVTKSGEKLIRQTIKLWSNYANNGRNSHTLEREVTCTCQYNQFYVLSVFTTFLLSAVVTAMRGRGEDIILCLTVFMIDNSFMWRQEFSCDQIRVASEYILIHSHSFDSMVT